MAYCDKCGNFDESYREDLDYTTDSHLEAQNYQPDLYYYWDSPIEEIYYWRDAFPNVDCMCEVCFAESFNKINKFIFIPTECIFQELFD